jgi:hypothetical protein
MLTLTRTEAVTTWTTVLASTTSVVYVMETVLHVLMRVWIMMMPYLLLVAALMPLVF